MLLLSIYSLNVLTHFLCYHPKVLKYAKIIIHKYLIAKAQDIDKDGKGGSNAE